MPINFNRATTWLSTPEGICTIAGVLVLAATTNANVIHYSGWYSTDAGVIAAMGFGIFAGARMLGANPKDLGMVGVVLVVAMIAGEAWNFFATGETTIASREAKAKPMRDAAQKHADAVKRLADLETGEHESKRLVEARAAIAALSDEKETSRVKAARDDLKTARDKLIEESRNGCRTTCAIKKDAVAAQESELQAALAAQRADREKASDDARAELQAALAASAADYKAELEKAKADVEANPPPADDAPLAHSIGWAPWALDLLAAVLRSTGCNGLAASLIALGARRKPDQPDQKADESGKSDNSEAKVREMPAANDTGPVNPGPAGPGGPKSGKRGRRPNAEVIEFADAFTARNGRAPTGPEIRAQFPDLGRTTAYDYAAKVRVSG